MNGETLEDLLHTLQLNGISDPLVLDAIARTPREMFISEYGLKRLAYADEPIPIECEQTISQPYIVAYMTERLHLSSACDVLEIGTGSGYQAAILSRLARHVFTIEYYRKLHQLATERFAELGLANVTAIQGDGSQGWPDFRLFERIIVTAGTEQVPEELLKQLAPCGFLVIPLGPRGNQRITLITRSNGRVTSQSLLPVCFVPLLGAHG
jgi:protein-L-isoaspartate(D-aspartate) O-methyltransferase